MIVVNATDDSALTDSAVAMLHDALRPPSRVLWSPGDHVHPKRPETIAFIADLLIGHLATANVPAAHSP